MRRHGSALANYTAVAIVAVILTGHWLPLGPQKGLVLNFLFVALLLGGLLLGFFFLARFYTRLLAWCLGHKVLFLSFPVVLILLGVTIWLGFDSVFAFLPGVPGDGQQSALARLWAGPRQAFPGLGKEFMPPLDEGSYLFMPTTMPHASIGEALDVLAKQDMAISGIPEVDQVVGKLGRADTPLDPAPISMIETVINYKPEYSAGPATATVCNFRYDRRTRGLRAGFGRRTDSRPPRPALPAVARRRSAPPDDIWEEIVKRHESAGHDLGAQAAAHRRPDRHAPERHARAHGREGQRSRPGDASRRWASRSSASSRRCRPSSRPPSSPTASWASPTWRSRSTATPSPATA